MIRSSKWLSALLLAVVGVGCADSGADKVEGEVGVPWDNPAKGPTGRWPGQTEFESAGPWRHVFGPFMRAMGGNLEANAQAAEAKRTVEESDIVKVDGTKVYALNPYRGLVVVDIANPDQPKIEGRLEILGSPQEMYVRGDRAYVMMNDYYTYRGTEQKYGSQVLVVDLAIAKKPALIGTFGIDGYVSDSRLVGDALYVVSTDYDYTSEAGPQTHVRSFNVHNPADVQEVDHIEFAGSGHLIHATDHHMFVAKYAYPNTKIQTIDISSPEGAMKNGNEVEVAGYIQDKFMMDFSGDHLRVVAHKWDQGGRIFVDTYALDRDANRLTKDGSLELGDIGMLTAARFEGERVYLVHQVRVDPLDVVDLSNPSAPKLLDRIEIPGWLERIETRGNRLIGVGFDQAGTPAPQRLCEGYNYEPLTEGRKLTVALYDVTDTGTVCEAARVRFGSGDWAWSSSFYDDKAMKFIDAENLILIPYSSYEGNKYTTAVQMVDVNLEAMQVTVRGHLENQSNVDRSFLAQDRLMALSDRQIAVANIDDRDHPVVTGKVELARNITAFQPAGPKGHGVQLIGGDWDEKTSEIRVVELANADAEETAVKGKVTLDAPGGEMFVDGNTVTILSRIYDEQGQRAKLSNIDVSDPTHPTVKGAIELPVGYGFNPRPWGMYRYSTAQDVVRVRPDLFVVSAPEEEGMKYSLVSIKDPANPKVTFEHKRANDKTVVTDLKVWWNDLYVVSYTPVQEETPELEGEFGVALDRGENPDAAQIVADRRILPPFRASRERVKYYVTRVSFAADGKPTIGAAVNVPGRLVDVSEDKKVWTLLDSRWDESNQDEQTKALFSVKLASSKASLLDGIPVEQGVEDVKVRGQAAYYSVMFNDWRGPVVPLAAEPAAEGEAVVVPEPKNPELQLVVLDYKNPAKIHEASRTVVADDGSYGNLLEVRQVSNDRFAFVSTGWGGLAVFDVTKAKSPKLFNFERSNAWYSNVVVHPQSKAAYMAGGMYGVKTLSLKK